MGATGRRASQWLVAAWLLVGGWGPGRADAIVTPPLPPPLLTTPLPLRISPPPVLTPSCEDDFMVPGPCGHAGLPCPAPCPPPCPLPCPAPCPLPCPAPLLLPPPL